MSNAYRFDLDTAIASWRRTLVYNRAFTADDLDELERHVRDQVAALRTHGLPEKEAFRRTMREMGSYDEAEAEYRKVYWAKLKKRHLLLTELIWRTTLLKNYIVIALRNGRRHPGYTFINMGGLAVGMACCLLIFLYVQDELSYDRFHEKADRIYRVVTNKSTTTPGPLAPTLAETFPDVEGTVRLYAFNVWGELGLLSYGDRQFYEEHFYMTDPSFFQVFDFPLVQGDGQTALHDPFSMVLTETMVTKYFGDEDPLGKTITYDNELVYTITGVLKDTPSTSHLQPDFLVPLQGITTLRSADALEGWYNHAYQTYVLLTPDAGPSRLEAALPGIFEQGRGETLQAELALQPLTDIYLHSNLDDELGATGDVATLYVLSLLAVLILLIACINFMNLATARAARRAKEVGVRKVMGAYRQQLIYQFLSESVGAALLALPLAILLVEALLPAFNELTGKSLDVAYAHNIAWLLALGGAVLLVGIGAGSYPAFVLSRFHPVRVLKGAGGLVRRSPVRNALVVLQFALSMLMIVATTVVYQQLDYAQTKQLGFNQEQVVAIPIRGRAAKEHVEVLKAELMQHPSVLRVTGSSRTPGQDLNRWGMKKAADPTEEEFLIRQLWIDADFIKTYDLELLTGRDFSRDLITDASEAFILNERAVRAFGWQAPEAALGQRIGTFGKEGVVIGVVKDFHFRSLQHTIEPTALHLAPRRMNVVSVRLNTADVAGTLVSLAQRWKHVFPNRPFDFFFVDEDYARQYDAALRLGTVFGWVTALAILLACLGLFGLASFTTEQRTKEIGVRKALGASAGSLTALLTKDFARLVGIAFLVAAPMAYVMMNQWLESFAYHIDIGPGVFLMAGALTLLIALLTVSYQAVKAALADPVQTLRYE